MKSAFKLEWYYQRIFLTRKLNGLINFGLKIPLIKELFPSQPYDTFKGKRIIFLVLSVLNVLKTIIAKGIWLTGGFAIGQNLSHLVRHKAGLSLEAGLFGWFFLTVILFNGSRHLISSSFDKEAQEFTRQFQIDRKIYLQSSMFVDLFINLVAYLPAGIMMAFFFKSLWLPFWIITSYGGGILLFEVMRRFMIRDKTTNPYWIWPVLLFLLVVVVSAFSGYFMLSKDISLINFYGVAVAAFLSLICFYAIQKNPFENNYLERQIEKGSHDLEVFKKKDNQYIASGISMQKELTLDESDSYEKLSGSQYLNALLFHRYRHILGKRVMVQSGILAAIAVVLIVIRLINGPMNIDEKAISAFFPTLFFIIYLADFGRTIVQMVFVNCDRAMLYYPFYREPKTIISGFNYRFFKSFLYNSTLCGGIFLLALLFSAMNHFSLSGLYLGTLAFLLIGLNFLFSFHALFVYYLLQPFTGDMEVVNPLYKVVSGATYFVAYMNIQLKFTGLTYALVVAAASLLYVGIGFLILYKKAPKTFRIK